VVKLLVFSRRIARLARLSSFKQKRGLASDNPFTKISLAYSALQGFNIWSWQRKQE
jgi:hypothetical protein